MPDTTPATDSPPDDRQVKPFAAFLQEHAGGRTHTELSEALVEIVAAVQETGKAGSITLTIGIKPTNKDNNTGTVTVTDDVKVKRPQIARPASVFFVSDDHNLHRDNPRQMKLPLREVPRGDAAEAVNR